MNDIKYFMSRTLILYLVASAVIFFVLDYKAAMWHSYGATLSRLQPSYEYLTKYFDGKVPHERKEFLAYRLFFSQLVKVLPDRADGYLMLGYCQHELGDTDAAVKSFKKAADAVPPFLWFNYAAGFAYYQKKDYAHAIEYLNKAVVSNPDVVVKYIAASKPYLDLIALMPDFQKDFGQRVRGGLRDSYKLLVLSYFYSQQYEPLLGVAQAAVKQNLDDDGFFLYYLGVGAYYAKQYEPSLMYLQQSIRVNPDAAEVYFYLGLNFKALGQESLAVAALQKSKELEVSKGLQFADLRHIRLRVL